MVRSRYVQVAFALLACLLVSACGNPSNMAAAKRNSDTSWAPKWDTGPDKSRKEKSVLRPTVSFADLGFRGRPVPQNETEKKQAVKIQESFVESFRKEPQCFGITLRLKNAEEADFRLQVFEGIDGRTGRWQWILYRMDTLGEKAHGEGTGEGPNAIVKSVCSTIRDDAFSQGGSVEE
jgi:hypothetical protein